MAQNDWADTAVTIKTLNDALATYDWPAAHRICSQLIGDIDTATLPYPEKPARQILNMLRRKRRFPLMELVADAMLRAGQSSAEVRRQYAQCLIDQGRYTAARAVLDLITVDPGAPEGEKAEARGLIGRIYKQLYVNSHDPTNPRQRENLRQAVHQYYSVYETNPKEFLWHGINGVACLARGRADKLDLKEFRTPEDLAKEIEGLLEKRDDLEYWDRATAVESAVALADWKSAYDHAVYYVSDARVDAFEIGSLLRQLTEVWRLAIAGEPGATLLSTLKAALLRAEGGSATIATGSVTIERSAADYAKKNLENVSKGNLEKVFGADRFQPLGWYKAGLQRCEAVARIESLIGTRIGTGFLVQASDFFPARSEKELLLLTNAHVISPGDKPYPGALPPEAAVAIFDANSRSFCLGDVVWSSVPDELDATFVTLKSFGRDSSEFCPLRPPAAAFDRTRQQRVYVIGYPDGGGLSFSLQDSFWLDTDGIVLHYRTPTNPGSSGSPVFDEQFWTVVALHHAGAMDIPRLNGVEGTYEANEGISITAIQKATRQLAAKAEPETAN